MQAPSFIKRRNSGNRRFFLSRDRRHPAFHKTWRRSYAAGAPGHLPALERSRAERAGGSLASAATSAARWLCTVEELRGARGGAGRAAIGVQIENARRELWNGHQYRDRPSSRSSSRRAQARQALARERAAAGAAAADHGRGDRAAPREALRCRAAVDRDGGEPVVPHAPQEARLALALPWQQVAVRPRDAGVRMLRMGPVPCLVKPSLDFESR